MSIDVKEILEIMGLTKSEIDRIAKEEAGLKPQFDEEIKAGEFYTTESSKVDDIE